MIERARHRGGRDDLLPRRDPPLQQGAAGRAAAGRRGGPRDADRRDDREPALRGQQRAALARHGVRARAARRRRTSRALLRARARARRARRRRRSTTTRSSCSRRAAAATRASRSARSSAPPRSRDGRVDARRGARRRSPRGLVRYDRAGDQHYDTISAWIKATRGSDPDASLYYLATMLEGGEDPRFIARRMVILASEDIGNADPQALVRRRRRGRGRRARRPARVHLRARAGRDPPRRSRRSPNAAGRALGAARELIRREGARAAPPASCAAPATTTTRTATPATSSPQELMPEGLEGVRFYAPDERRGGARRRRSRACAPRRGRTP